jgi:hypothetical protein
MTNVGNQFVNVAEYRSPDRICLDWLNPAIAAWPHGGSHGGAFRVMLGIGMNAYTAGTESFNASHRRLAEISGVDVASSPSAYGGHATCSRSLRMLHDWGVISVTKDEVEVGMASTRITLVHACGSHSRLSPDDPSNSYKTRLCLRPGVSGITELRDWLNPVFEHAGIGVLACRVWHLLRRGAAMSAAEIGQCLRVSRQSAHAQLKKLEYQRMAIQQHSSPRWQSIDRNLNGLAQELGVGDRLENRKAINHRERNNYRRAERARRTEL